VFGAAENLLDEGLLDTDRSGNGRHSKEHT
jgi:hypothetical protein